MMSLILELLIPTNERQEIDVISLSWECCWKKKALHYQTTDRQRTVDLACVADFSVQQQLISITSKQTSEVFCTTS